MRRASLIVLLSLLIPNFGCAYHAVVGNQSTRRGEFYGEVGITGHLNEVTIARESRLWKLSLIGDANKVIIEDNVRLNKIEFWGSNNEVTMPEHMYDGITTRNVGKGNVILRRIPAPPGVPNYNIITAPVAPGTTTYELPPPSTTPGPTVTTYDLRESPSGSSSTTSSSTLPPSSSGSSSEAVNTYILHQQGQQPQPAPASPSTAAPSRPPEPMSPVNEPRPRQ